jgi:hypothetical protein
MWGAYYKLGDKITLSAKHKEKGIKVRVYFFTTNLGIKKQAWDAGTIIVMANKAHGLRCENIGKSLHFDGIENILPNIKEALKQADITLFDYKQRNRRKVAIDLD